MPFRNLSISWCHIHIFLGISRLQCVQGVEGLLIHVCTITSSVAREQRMRAGLSLSILRFLHEVCRMIITVTNPASLGIALLALGNLMILGVSLMMIMITHAAIVHFQLCT